MYFERWCKQKKSQFNVIIINVDIINVLVFIKSNMNTKNNISYFDFITR
jgi:hypothetical protein